MFCSQELKNDRFVIPKSRYDSIDSYLSECNERYNDNKLLYDEDIYNKLRAAGKHTGLSQIC